MDSSPPGSSVHGILQARILGWVAMPSSRGSSWPKGQTWVSCISSTGRQILYHCAPWESPWSNYPISIIYPTSIAALLDPSTNQSINQSINYSFSASPEVMQILIIHNERHKLILHLKTQKPAPPLGPLLPSALLSHSQTNLTIGNCEEVTFQNASQGTYFKGLTTGSERKLLRSWHSLLWNIQSLLREVQEMRRLEGLAW